MPFKKGQSGNPGGRPKALAEVQALARSYCAESIEGLRALAKDSKTPAAARVSAHIAILDRGIGKPLATVASISMNKTPREMTDAELMARIMELEDDASGPESAASLAPGSH